MWENFYNFVQSAGKITKAEIDRRWMHSSLNEYHESRIPDRTFYRCLNEIEMLFDIEILCERSPYGGQYYIAESDSNSKTKQWLLSQFAMSQSLDTSRELQDQILYEPIPAGTEYLTTIVEAMREKKKLHVAHLRFDSTEPPHEFLLAPLCLKVFKKKFNPKAYFSGYYGVFCGKQYTPEIVRARVVPIAAKFLRSLPLHHSQKEIEPCVFEWFVAPTLDFIQQLRTYGSELEILHPQSLREQFKAELEQQLALYK